MLPFLRKKSEASQPGIIMKTRTPDATTEPEVGDESDHAIEAAASDLIDAVHSKDIKRTADAIKAAFEICESQPHEEGEHTNDYDAMNAAAAKGQD